MPRRSSSPQKPTWPKQIPSTVCDSASIKLVKSVEYIRSAIAACVLIKQLSNADLQTVQLIQRTAQKVMLKKHEEERANKAKGQISNRGIAAATRGFSPRSLLSAPLA